VPRILGIKHSKNDIDELLKDDSTPTSSTRSLGTMQMLIYWKNTNNVETIKTSVKIIEIQVKTASI